MSAAEILQELPKLTADERSVVRRRLLELEGKEDVQFLNDSTLAMMQELDKREADDDRQARAARLKSFFSEWDASHSVTVGEQPTRARTYADNPRLR